tara:strand:- start:90 stop:2099 length:2010 start_codon:yes stop_codon:yes gene_type:complete
MCGIIGVFGKDCKVRVEKGLDILRNRGRDGRDIYCGDGFTLGHCLHSIVGFVKQPIVGKGVLVANCEIYNWEELNEKFKLNCKNDSEVLFKLLEEKDVLEVLDLLDGVYAFAYYREGKLFLARDIIGVKPLWYSFSDGFSFASEKKALVGAIELNPREVLVYDGKVSFLKRDFFKIVPEVDGSKVEELFLDALKKRVPKKKFGLLFSGGIDSTLIAFALKKLGYDFTCYTAVLDDPDFKEPEDLVYSQKIAKELGLDLKVVKIKLDDVEKYLEKIVPLIEDSNVVKVGVALTFYKACSEAAKDGCKVIFSGLGSEEIFAGYERHKGARNVNEECISGLLKMYERDMYRDDVITMYHQLELRLPFLDRNLVEYSLKIPEGMKLKDGMTKVVLRECAVKMGLNEEFAFRKKKAAQYGSNFHKALKKLSKKNGFARISEYVLGFYPKQNVKLGALVSSGKDGLYAMYVMMKQNYDIGCMVTLKSLNKESFMFHTPSVDLVKLQSESIGIPVLEFETEGVKEDELEDLKKALSLAKEKFGIQGIVCGALFSNYQRERVDKVADSLGLKMFVPLWHMDQETEMKEIIGAGFKFVLSSVAAEGLDESWVGREIGLDDVHRLAKKKGFNVAGEGGEFESLVLDGPIFSKKLVLKEFGVKMESECCGILDVKSVELE